MSSAASSSRSVSHFDADLLAELESIGVGPGPAAVSISGASDAPPPYTSAALPPSVSASSSAARPWSVSASSVRASSVAVPASIRVGGSVNPELLKLEAERKALEELNAEQSRKLDELKRDIGGLADYEKVVEADEKAVEAATAENKRNDEETRAELESQARSLAAEKAKLQSENARDAAQIERLRRKNAEDAAKAKERGAVDVAIVMDVTSSMGKWLTDVQSKMNDVVHEVARAQGLTDLRFAFIGYRDWFDERRFEEVPFTDNVHEFMNQVRAISVTGGGDPPEDVLGGLDKALDLKWKARTKLVILIADAPCHGSEYHMSKGLDDAKSLRYMAEGRDTLDPSTLLVTMRDRAIDLVATEIHSSTRVCFEKFKQYYDHPARVRTMKVIPLSAAADDFVPRISASISQSIAANRHAAGGAVKVPSSRSVLRAM